MKLKTDSIIPAPTLHLQPIEQYKIRPLGRPQYEIVKAHWFHIPLISSYKYLRVSFLLFHQTVWFTPDWSKIIFCFIMKHKWIWFMFLLWIWFTKIWFMFLFWIWSKISLVTLTKINPLCSDLEITHKEARSEHCSHPINNLMMRY